MAHIKSNQYSFLESLYVKFFQIVIITQKLKLSDENDLLRFF